MADLPKGFVVDPLQSFGSKLDEGREDKDRSKPFVGSAIQEDKVRFLSVSQIKLWDPTQYGGCKRRYAAKYKFKVKVDDDTEATRAGRDEYAKGIEDWYKTGEDALVPVLRAAKHLFPKPGPDIESERPLGDYGAAVTLRDAVLFGGDPSRWESHFERRLRTVNDKIDRAIEQEDTERLKALGVERQWIVSGRDFALALDPAARLAATQVEIKRLAGLTAAGIPLDGAPDVGHARGEFISNSGLLTREDADKRVVEVIDLKSTRQINDRANRKTGEVYKGLAKTVEEVLRDPQMVGYGVAAADRRPDVTHVRLTHIYVQTKPPFAGERRTGLITVDEVRERWRRVDGLALELEDAVASASSLDDFAPNYASCNSYHRPCPYERVCKRPTMTIMDALGLSVPKENKMGNGLFDSPGLPPPPTNGVNGASLGLFGAVQAPPPPSAAPPPPPTEAERAAAVEAHKAKLLGETGLIDGIEGYPRGMGCNGLGYYVNQDHTGGHMVVEAGHVHNVNCKVPVQQPPAIGQVNPPDQPPPDPIADSSPLTAEQIAAIEDPVIRERAAEHARQHALREAANEAAKPKKEKKGGRCPASGTKVQLTVKEAASRPIKKICTCGKEYKIKSDDIVFEGDVPFFVVGSHNLPKVEEVPAAASTPPAPPPVVTQAPPAPVTLPPPPPETTAGSVTVAYTTAPPPPPPEPGIVVGSPTSTTMPLPPAITPAPTIATATAGPVEAQQLLVAGITAKIARALIDALLPFAEGK